MALTDLPPEARPREKLLALGPGSLADAELLALLLRTGLAGKGVLQLAQEVLTRFGGFAGLLKAELADLARIKGLGPAKRAEIAAVLEIARRSLAQELRAQPVLSSAQAVRQYVQMELGGLAQEVFAVIFLDTHLRLLRLERMFSGTLSQATVYPREVARRALELGASGVILAHNHPSGVAEPSLADRRLTERLQATLGLIDVRVIDHLIVGAGEPFSFAESGLL